MGEVYRARDTKLNRDVAIKVLPDAVASDAERLARFTREAQTLGSLNHPNIATIHGIEERDGLRAIVMELVDGPTLADRLASGSRRLSIVEAADIARQLADALDAAHEKGIVHRDLKPANIALTKDGVVKVLDFGLAKLVSNDSRPAGLSQTTMGETRDGAIVGTPAYMSPEQARGQTVDKRTDIWAFGCVAFEMLAGRPAFGGTTFTDTLAAIVEREPDWSALPTGLPANVRSLIQRCLKKDQKQRMRDIGDARHELADALSTAADANVHERAGSGRRRAALSAFVLVLASLVGGLAVWQLRPASAPPALALARFTIPLPAGERLALGARSVAISPNGEYIAFDTGRELGRKLYLRALSGSDARLITEASGGNPFFSPDSEWLGFFEDGKMKKVPVRGGPAQTIVDASANRGGTWSVDGTIVFAPQSRVVLSQVKADGGAPQGIATLDASRGETSHRQPVFLPDGKTVIYRAEGSTYADGALVARRLDTGELRVLVPEGGLDAAYSPTGHLLFLRDNNLMAAPFDADRLSVTGPPALVAEGLATFAISANGSLVYGPVASRGLDLVWVDRRGSVEPLPAPPQMYGHPRLSPDGRRVLVNIQTGPGRHIWTYDIAQDSFKRLTFENSNFWPLWSPDGSRAIYASNRPGSTWDILMQPGDGSGAPETVLTTPAIETPQAISPDGEWLAYSSADPVTGEDLWLMPMRVKGAPREVARTKARENESTFSPDSRWIAYSSDESGRPEIYVKQVSDAPGKWQISTDGGNEPLWSTSGRELFFRNAGKMMAVDVVTAPAFSAGKPRLLFEGSFPLSGIGSQNYDVTRDGMRFLMLRPQASAIEPLNFVANWFEELKRLAPAAPR
jgi:eukaryotic-like serine/threonine-protein kinase